MDEDHHRIESFRFRLGTPYHISPHDMQNVISDIFKHYIHPRLSSMFTECSGDQVVTIDTLDINLGQLDFESLQQQLPKLILAALRQHILSALPDKSSHSNKRLPNSLKIAIYLLQHGATPWWAPQAASHSLHYWLSTALKDAPQLFLEFLTSHFHQPTVNTRFINNITSDISSKIAQIIPSIDTKQHNSSLIQYFKKNHNQYFSPHTHSLLKHLQAPSGLTPSSRLKRLLQNAEAESSPHQIRQILLPLLNDPNYRWKLIKHISEQSLRHITEYLTPPEQTSTLQQIDTLTALIQYHFPHDSSRANHMKHRIWDLSIKYLLDTSTNTNLTHSILLILSNEEDLFHQDFIHSTKTFLKQKTNNLSTHEFQQLTSWLHSASQKTSNQGSFHSEERHLHEVHQTENHHKYPLNTNATSIQRSIQHLFHQIEAQTSAVTSSTQLQLLELLRKENYHNVRHIYLEKNNFRTILHLPSSLQIQLLSILHPTQTSTHQTILLQIWPLTQLKFPNQPWTGKQIYQEIMTLLISEQTPPPSITTSARLQQLLRKTASRLNIPDRVWQHSIPFVTPPILTSKHFSGNSATANKQLIRQLKQALQASTKRSNDNYLSTALTRALKQGLPDLLKHTLKTHLRSNKEIIDFTAKLTNKELHDTVKFLDRSNPSGFESLISELLSVIPQLPKTQTLPHQQQLRDIQTRVLKFILMTTKPEPKLWFQNFIAHFTKENSISVEQIKQTIQPSIHPTLYNLQSLIETDEATNLKNKPILSHPPQGVLTARKTEKHLVHPSPEIEEKPAITTEHLLDPKVSKLSVHPMPELWSEMLEKLWKTDPLAVIQQLSQVTLYGSHATEYYQAIPAQFLQHILHTLYPQITSSLTNLQKDLNTLFSHKLLPGLHDASDFQAIITPPLIVALHSTHLLHPTNTSITRIIFQALAEQQGIPFHQYLGQLLDNLNNAPSDWIQTSPLTSHLTYLNDTTVSEPGLAIPLFPKIDPFLHKSLQSLIEEHSPSLTNQKTILQHCLTLLPSLWPEYTSPTQILSLALYDLKITVPKELPLSKEQQKVEQYATQLHHLESLFTPNTPIPEENTLINSLNTIAQQLPQFILAPLSKHIHQPDFIETLEKRSIKLQSTLLNILAPQPTILLKALISKILTTPESPSEKLLWSHALQSISHFYPNQLRADNSNHLIIHFLSLDSVSNSIPIAKQSEMLRNIQPPRLQAGHARLNTLLHQISLNHPTSPPQEANSPHQQHSLEEVQARLHKDESNFTLEDFNNITKLLPIAPSYIPFLNDLADTIIAIDLQQQTRPNLKPLITPLLQDNFKPQEIVHQLLLATAAQHNQSILELAQSHWPLIQNLSSSYQDPQTLPTLYTTIISIIPTREIPLPQLPGSNQTIFETDPPETTSIVQPAQPQKTPPIIEPGNPDQVLDSPEIEREIWLVENAGLILFAPYFEMLLERAGLIQNKHFPNIDQAIQGVFLFQYLVTGQNEAEEHHLLLNRILCNVPLDHALPKSVEPGDDWQQLTDGLIGAVIQHWNTLGNTSSESLLNTFVKREGSLRFDHEEGWSLHIPEEPYDMLLNTLPWAISTVHLPWMEQALRVEWK